MILRSEEVKREDPIVQIPKAMSEFLPIVKHVYGDQLCMVALYGSAATGTWVSGVSDINILIIVEKADPDRLMELGRALGKRQLIQRYRLTPHILSRQELVSSSDIFPVEYLELQESLELLEGKDLFADLTVSIDNLRHQVEAMTRGSVNTLRQIVISSAGDRKRLQAALQSWGGRQIPLYRAVLRLTSMAKGSESSSQPQGKGHDAQLRDLGALISRMAESLGLDKTPFLELQELREQGAKGTIDPLTLIPRLQRQYLLMLDTVDTYETK